MKKIITALNLTQNLNALLDPTTMSDFGLNGLIVTNEGPIHKIATSFSPSLEVIQKAVSLKVNALIVHHGLGQEFSLANGTSYKKMKALINNNIALLRYHLPLDAHQELGNNWKAARDLGWQNLEYFGMCNNSLIGVSGTFAPISFIDFVNKLEKYYGNKATLVEVKKEIFSAALISGGAHKYIQEAARAGVDCFITGTFDDPTWDIAHEENISFCAFGHAATEKIGPKALAEYIQKNYNIESIFIDTKNPF